MKRFLTLLLVVSTLVFGGSLQSGCNSTLDPAGAYHGDKVAYNTDATIDSLYKVIDTFLAWEKQNQVSGHNNPKVHQFAEMLRREAPQWFSSAIALRKAYEANPTAENKSALNKTLDVLTAAVNEATKYLTQSATP